MSEQSNSFEKPGLSDTDRISVLLEECRALYGLLRFRLDAMDQRLPLAGGVLITVLSGLLSMPSDMARVLLLALPSAIVWLGRMTVTHARSKEDVKTHIVGLEQRINEIAGQDLLAFQSRHPGRGHVGGRTGMATVVAVVTLCVTMLAACGYLFGVLVASIFAQLAYGTFVAVLGLYLTVLAWDLRRYRCPGPETRVPAFGSEPSDTQHL